MATRKSDIQMYQNKEEKYIVLADLEYGWLSNDIEIVKTMWGEGYHIEDISKEIDREIEEVFLLLLDQARKGKIKRRTNGVFGVV